MQPVNIILNISVYRGSCAEIQVLEDSRARFSLSLLNVRHFPNIFQHFPNIFQHFPKSIFQVSDGGRGPSSAVRGEDRDGRGRGACRILDDTAVDTRSVLLVLEVAFHVQNLAMGKQVKRPVPVKQFVVVIYELLEL
jgi:hypothetical protein